MCTASTSSPLQLRPMPYSPAPLQPDTLSMATTCLPPITYPSPIPSSKLFSICLAYIKDANLPKPDSNPNPTGPNRNILILG